MIDILVSALSDEFEGDVIFSSWIPAQISPPAVIVAPGEPFLNPGTMGAVEENWRVLVAVSIKDPKSGIDQMRDLSLRVRRSVHSVGGFWRQAGGPYTTQETNAQTVISANEVTFKYLPPNGGDA